MNDGAEPPYLQRFLRPRFALAELGPMVWQGVGEADTPAADARCRLYLGTDGNGGDISIASAGFAAFGPPVVVACADWACERLANRTIGQARSLSVRDFEQALALAPQERYAALLVIDALASALDNLGS